MACKESTGKLIAVRQIAQRLVAGLQPLAEPADPRIGGLSVDAWLVLFLDCYEGTGMGIRRVEWPDVGGIAEQPNLTVAMFSVLQDVVITQAEKHSGG